MAKKCPEDVYFVVEKGVYDQCGDLIDQGHGVEYQVEFPEAIGVADEPNNPYKGCKEIDKEVGYLYLDGPYEDKHCLSEYEQTLHELHIVFIVGC